MGKKELKTAAFTKDLIALLRQYNVTIHESELYDGEDNYRGSELYFVIDGDILYEQTVQEIVEALTKTRAATHRQPL